MLGELVAGRGFEHDNLYCEWTLDYDPAVWSVEGDDAATSGVTQVSKTVAYPPTGDGEGDGAFSANRLVAHWALPFELNLVAREEPNPGDWPCVYFQVSSYDAWDRYRCEGYGRLALGACASGRNEVVVKTWRAGGSLLDRMKTHYAGGAAEIGDVTYAGVPRDAKRGGAHSRLGFVADASGDVKVRAHVMIQRPRQASSAAKKGFDKLKSLFASGDISGGGGDGDGLEGTAEGRRVAAEREVVDVVARARARIAEARAQGRADPKAVPRAMLLARAPAPARGRRRGRGRRGRSRRAFRGDGDGDGFRERGRIQSRRHRHVGGGGGEALERGCVRRVVRSAVTRAIRRFRGACFGNSSACKIMTRRTRARVDVVAFVSSAPSRPSPFFRAPALRYSLLSLLTLSPRAPRR